MAQYTNIMASEYNAIRTKVNDIITSGSGNKGYGGTMSSSNVAGGDIITAAHFDNLRGDIDKAVRHQTGLLSTLTDIAIGDTVNWANMVAYDLKADNITTNRDNIYTGATVGSYIAQASVVSGGTKTLSSGWGVDSAGHGKVEMNYNVTWTSDDAARYFFNTGGYLKLTFGRSGTASNTKSVGWQAIIDNLSTTAASTLFDATKYRQGVAGTTTTWDYKRYDTTNPYTENYGQFRFFFYNAHTIKIWVELYDLDVGDQTGLGPAVDESVTIDITSGLDYRTSINQFNPETPTFTLPNWAFVSSVLT